MCCCLPFCAPAPCANPTTCRTTRIQPAARMLIVAHLRTHLNLHNRMLEVSGALQKRVGGGKIYRGNTIVRVRISPSGEGTNILETYPWCRRSARGVPAVLLAGRD